MWPPWSTTPAPKAGVFAVRQGKPLYENLLAPAGRQPPQTLPSPKTIPHPDRRGLMAAPSLPEDLFLWNPPSFARWKNHIDQKFMDLFREFPSMEEMKPQNYRTPPLLH